jgi:hypothetical protein
MVGPDLITLPGRGFNALNAKDAGAVDSDAVVGVLLLIVSPAWLLLCSVGSTESAVRLALGAGRMRLFRA